MKTKIFYVIIALSVLLILFGSFLFGRFCTKISFPWNKKYSNVSTLCEGIREATLKNGKVILLDVKGEQISPVVDYFFDEIYPLDSLIIYKKGGFRGYFNLRKKTDQIPADEKRFTKAWVFDNQTGLAAVLDAETQKVGFINNFGKYIIAPYIQYEEYHNYVFSNGECVVPDSTGNYIVINPQGKNNTGLSFLYISDLVNGMRVVQNAEEHYGVVKDDILLLPCDYENIQINEDEIVLCKNQKQWSVDYKLNIKRPFVFDNFATLVIHSQVNFGEEGNCEYSDVNSNENSTDVIANYRYSLVQINYKEGIFDNQSNKMIVPSIYDEIYAVGKTENNFSLFGKQNELYYPLKLK